MTISDGNISLFVVFSSSFQNMFVVVCIKYSIKILSIEVFHLY